MEIEEIEEKLDESIANVPWRYKVLNESDIIEFTNVEVESVAEEKFLKELEEEGSSKLVGGSGKFSYLIKREDGRLWASLAKKDGEVMNELGEITEKEALGIRGPDNADEGVLGEFLSMFSEQKRDKEPVSNRINLDFNFINDINVEKSEKTQNKSVIIIGEDFKINLRSDGGCQINFT